MLDLYGQCELVSHLLLQEIIPVISSHQREAQKWPLTAGGCLMEVNIRTKLKFDNILYGCLRQVGCLIEVTANTGLTVYQVTFILLLAVDN